MLPNLRRRHGVTKGPCWPGRSRMGKSAPPAIRLGGSRMGKHHSSRSQNLQGQGTPTAQGICRTNCAAELGLKGPFSCPVVISISPGDGVSKNVPRTYKPTNKPRPACAHTYAVKPRTLLQVTGRSQKHSHPESVKGEIDPEGRRPTNQQA